MLSKTGINIARLFSTSGKCARFGSVNRVTLVGNVGQTPEIRELDEDKVMANFSLATSDRVRNQETQELEKRTDWHRISVLNSKTASFVRDYVEKGSKVYVEGKIKYREVERDGIKKLFTNIDVGYDGQITVLSPKESRSEQSNSQEQMSEEPVLEKKKERISSRGSR